MRENIENLIAHYEKKLLKQTELDEQTIEQYETFIEELKEIIEKEDIEKEKNSPKKNKKQQKHKSIKNQEYVKYNIEPELICKRKNKKNIEY